MGLIGTVLGSRYALEEHLGAGAMGTVYRARHVKIGRQFAVKVLHQELLAHPGLVERFEQEAQVAGRLQHPNVVRVVDFGEMEDGTRFTVMDLVPGKQLSASLGAPMDPVRVMRLVTQLLDGLQHAHDVGLIHRDFKPDNVIIERGEDGSEIPRIVDFGIAILHQHASSYEARGRLTTMGVVLGTPEYMAPEQARGEVIDHRADLFALGITCYEMLTGKLPFEGSGVEVAIENMTNDTPAMGVRVPSVNIDPLLDAFTRKLTRKHPKDRPASAAEARALLKLIATDRTAAAIALGLAPRSRLPQVEDPEQTVPLRTLPLADPQQTVPLAVHRDVPPMVHAPVVAAPAVRAVARSPRRPSFVAVMMLVIVAALAIGVSREGAPASAVIVLEYPVPQDETLALSRRAVSSVTLSQLRPKPHARSAGPTARPARRDTVEPPVIATLVAAPPAAPVEVASTLASVMPEPPAVETANSSAVALASLYKQLGAEIAALGRTQGSHTTEDLWIQYRRVRFLDSIATEPSRKRASQVMLAIQRETARRRLGDKFDGRQEPGIAGE